MPSVLADDENAGRARTLGSSPDMFIAGNDADAKQRVRTLLGAFGWSVIDIGDIQ